MRTASHHVLPKEPGLHELTSDLQHLRFALARVGGDGDTVTLDTGAHEALVVVIEAPSGALVGVGEQEFALPPRASVFADEPSAVYVPPQSEMRLGGGVLAGIFLSPLEAADARSEAFAILPEEVTSVERGRGNFSRRVRDILPAGRPAGRLLAGETINPPGNWSSSPPHKHDRNLPGEEAQLEEIYLFRVDPAQGFGLQLSYTTDPPREEAFAVHDLDAVTIPAGYHPVVAGPGYALYYLWCLAGQGRELLWRPDPAHAWVDGG